MTYIHRFAVEGKGTFPLDMLRYDRCFPAKEADSAILHHILHPYDGQGVRCLFLERIGEKDWKPTTGRWESFGWKVVVIEKPSKLP